MLWEMLTGRQLFSGETVSHVLADVLRAPIDLDAIRLLDQATAIPLSGPEPAAGPAPCKAKNSVSAVANNRNRS